MSKLEEKVLRKYSKIINAQVKNKYRKRAEKQANEQKIYLSKEDCSGQLRRIKQIIYGSFEPLIKNEIQYRLNEIIESGDFEKAVEKERELQKKKLHYKSLKKYQKLPINIQEHFIKALSEEVNCDVKNKCEIIGDQEVRYLTLLVLYAIIDNILDRKVIKFSHLFRIWLNKRDFISNLPCVENKISINRMFPKFKLCDSYNNRLFKIINAKNEAIINFYRAKTDRFLKFLKVR